MAVQYIEGTGFIAIGNKMIMQVSDISLSYQTGTDEVLTFDSNFVKSYLPTTTSWTADASFIADTTTTGYASYTGGTAASTLTGSTNGLAVFELAKLRTVATLVIKLDDSNLQRGSVVITGVDVKASAGKFISGSIKLQGSGALAHAST